MSNPRGRRRWLFSLVLVLLVPASAVLVLRFLGRPPSVGAPVDQVIEDYGHPYYDSRVDEGDGPSRYTLFFRADNALAPRAFYVRVEDGKVAESWSWSK